jgi:acetylornithine deacetylase/succinyl-diaminopimelate desuccinylase-like protein
MSEEAGQHGSRALAAEEQFDFVIAGEPTNLDVVYRSKGCAFLELRTRGRAGHASCPEAGENAINKMLEVLYSSAVISHRSLRSTKIRSLAHRPSASEPSGEARRQNIIPDLCEASVDMRFVPSQFTPGFAEEHSERLRAICPDIELQFQPAPPLDTDPSHPLIGKLVEGGAHLVGAPWFCDAAFFAQRGMAAVALGPGSIAQAHTEDEWIEVKELNRGVEFFRAFLAALRES